MRAKLDSTEPSRRRRVAWLLIVALAWSVRAAEAQGVGTGTVTGRLTDESRGAMPGVTVTVNHGGPLTLFVEQKEHHANPSL